MAGNSNSGRKSFYLDESAPFRRQTGEPEKQHTRILRWKELGFPPIDTLQAEFEMSLRSINVMAKAYQWEKRRDLQLARAGKTMGQQLYGEPQRPKKKAMTSADETPPPPPPIPRGLHNFALKYGEVISPGFVIDEVVDAMLKELEAIIEGDAGGRLMINPPPRHSKTTCAILALCYSLLRYSDRGHILISANGRLATMNCALMRTLFEYAAPDGYKIKSDQKSKLAWSPNWEGARIQLAASRGGALLGYTGHFVCLDDILGNIAECESVDIMDTAMRTIGVDIMTRLTKDKAGKGQGLIMIAQRLGPNDTTARMIDRDKGRERAGDKVVPWTVLASPLLNPTNDELIRIRDSYPDSWLVKFPKFGTPGEPVSHRFTKEFAEELEAQMPPADFAAMYKLDCSVDVGYCSWRRTYLQPIANEDIKCRGSFIAIDMNLSGEKGSDTSALVAVGAQDGKAIILGIHEIAGHVEDALPQILDYADRYNCHTIGVEKAAGGHFVLRSLNNNVAGRTFNVVALSHEGRSKRNRQSKILGIAANGKVMIRDDIRLIDVLHEQQRSIALDRRKDRDDFADACNYALDWVNTHWLSSGFAPGDVRWAGGSNGVAGVTECVWGRGSHSLAKPVVGIDGVQRYQLPGFG